MRALREVKGFWVEIPRERRAGRHEIFHVEKKYVAELGEEAQVWYCRDRDNKRLKVSVFRHTPYYHEIGNEEFYKALEEISPDNNPDG